MTVTYTPVTQSLVITYSAREVMPEEVILRTSLALSKEYDFEPVRILASPDSVELKYLATLSGFLLLFNHSLNFFTPEIKSMTTLANISAGTTFAAVLDHLIQDLKHSGQVHPELFSIYYLITAALKGTALKGASITWLLTFARHIIQSPARALLVKIKEADPTCHIHQCEYVVTVGYDNTNSLRRLLGQLPQMALRTYLQSLKVDDRLLEQLQDVADSHDAVIEGLENLEQRIFLKVTA